MSAAIRPATAGDADALGRLLEELGYPTSTADVVTRLQRLEAAHNGIALVAEVEGETIGLVTAHLIDSLHSATPVAWLTTLVVSSRVASRGIGRQLVEAAERWAKERGSARIAVTSALHREGAHAFYERIGYARTGVRLGRQLRDPS